MKGVAIAACEVSCTMNWAMDLMKITLSCSVSISCGRSAVGSYLYVPAYMRREKERDWREGKRHQEKPLVCPCSYLAVLPS